MEDFGGGWFFVVGAFNCLGMVATLGMSKTKHIVELEFAGLATVVRSGILLDCVVRPCASSPSCQGYRLSVKHAAGPLENPGGSPEFIRRVNMQVTHYTVIHLYVH